MSNLKSAARIFSLPHTSSNEHGHDKRNQEQSQTSEPIRRQRSVPVPELALYKHSYIHPLLAHAICIPRHALHTLARTQRTRIRKYTYIRHTVARTWEQAGTRVWFRPLFPLAHRRPIRINQFDQKQQLERTEKPQGKGKRVSGRMEQAEERAKVKESQEAHRHTQELSACVTFLAEGNRENDSSAKERSHPIGAVGRVVLRTCISSKSFRCS